jgi:uncharacterized membrane protein
MSKVAKTFAGPIMAAAGINHFVMPKTYEAIMPDYLPAHRELVYASGVAEFAAAVATMHPRTRRAGGRLLIATLLAIFPANINMFVHAERFPKLPRWSLLLRLPLQGVMVYWAWVATQRDAAPAA